MKTDNGSSRLQFLDWTRGLGAVIMLQGHAFHSLLRKDLRTSPVFLVSDFLGGMPSAIFLFLTGATLAFLMDSRERKGASPSRRVWASLQRAGFILSLALAQRVQNWLAAGPGSGWSELLRVDILNAMGLALLVMAPLAVVAAVYRVRLAAGAGLLIAIASPLVSQLDMSRIPSAVRGYLAPDYAAFGFFPWAAFLAFGVSAGSLIRMLDAAQMERAMRWAAGLGCALLIGSRYLFAIPYSIYTKSEFWLNSPWMIFGKMGGILLLMAFAFAWTRYRGSRWSWVRQLGTTSLLVYWVHLMVYGRWLAPWQANLDLGHSALAAVALIAAMVGISAARTHYRKILAWFSTWRPQPVPARVSGD
jgi:fucose 4-O-acetylase-like acetyltransferase